jgi:ABC-2 type transport system ATP-binding protein
MVSSHLLGEIDKTATILGILSEGRMIFQGTRAELFSASTPDVIIDCSDPGHAKSLLARELDSSLDGGSVRLHGLDDQATARVVATLVGAGIGIYGVRRDEQSLEDVFMDLTKGGGL